MCLPLLLDVAAGLPVQDWQAVQECQPEQCWLVRFELVVEDRTNSAAKPAMTAAVVKNIVFGWF
jgi:hypothetical protein